MTDEPARINAAIASPPEPEPQSDADCRYQIPATAQAALRRMTNRLAAARQSSSRVPSEESGGHPASAAARRLRSSSPENGDRGVLRPTRLPR